MEQVIDRLDNTAQQQTRHSPCGIHEAAYRASQKQKFDDIARPDKRSRICVKRRIRKAPTMACSEAPMPILAASTVVFRIDAVLVVSRGVRRLIKNDPSKMPGQAVSEQ